MVEVLLETFDGLQNIYKRGYDRSKVMACYSHLEGPQLQDKHFEIPAIGASPAHEVKAVSNRSRLKSLSKTSSSGLSEMSLSKKASSKRKPELTQQKLHPEKFLFIKKNIAKEVVVRSDRCLDWLKEQHARKGQLD